VQTSYAAEGTKAHAIAESILNNTIKAYPTGFESVKNYVDYCIEEYEQLKAIHADAKFVIEQQVDFSFIVPGGFGTADFIAVGGDELVIVDLKYGKGVRVNAKDNPQLRLYAIGAVAAFISEYPIKTVKYVIMQPRLKRSSFEIMSLIDLLAWGVYEVHPKAMEAFKGVKLYKDGAHCKFCKASNICALFR
jgi:hypothetical protein